MPTILENGDRLTLTSPNADMTVKARNIPLSQFNLFFIPLNQEKKAIFDDVVINGEWSTANFNDDITFTCKVPLDLMPSEVDLIKVVFASEIHINDRIPLERLGGFDVTLKTKNEEGLVNGFHDFYGQSLRVGNFFRVGGDWVFEANAGCSENSIQDLFDQHKGV